MNEYKLYENLPSPCLTPEKKKKSSVWKKILIILLAISAITIGILSVILVFSKSPTIIHYSDSTSDRINPSGADDISISKLAEKCAPSTVYISTEGVIGGFFQQQIAVGEGSGVIVSDNGYILTSASILSSGTDINVMLSDGREFDAVVIGSNAQTDMTLLKIEADGLTPAILSDSDNLSVGDFVLAIGNPLAPQILNTVTHGSIAGINKDVSFENNVSINFLQIDVTTNSGNIGGPLFNSNGELAGIITGHITSNSQLSFAIPVNDAKPLLESHLNAPTTPQNDDVPMIGITGYNEPYGVIVEMVSKDSPASRAGLKTNDLIIKIDGEAINTVARINEIRLSHKRGDSMVLTVLRNNETLELTVVLE